MRRICEDISDITRPQFRTYTVQYGVAPDFSCTLWGHNCATSNYRCVPLDYEECIC